MTAPAFAGQSWITQPPRPAGAVVAPAEPAPPRRPAPDPMRAVGRLIDVVA